MCCCTVLVRHSWCYFSLSTVVFLSTITCISSNPCQEYILFSYQWKYKMKGNGSKFLGGTVSSWEPAQFCRGQEKSQLCSGYFFCHKCYLAVMYLCYHPEELNRFLFSVYKLCFVKGLAKGRWKKKFSFFPDMWQVWKYLCILEEKVTFRTDGSAVSRQVMWTCPVTVLLKSYKFQKSQEEVAWKLWEISLLENYEVQQLDFK